MGVRLNGCPTLWSAAKIRDAGNDAYVYHFAYHPDKPRGYDGAGTGDWAGLACHGADTSRNQQLAPYVSTVVVTRLLGHPAVMD